jgi:hypothetical protein
MQQRVNLARVMEEEMPNEEVMSLPDLELTPTTTEQDG